MTNEVGVRGKMVEGKTLAFCADANGNVMPICKGVLNHKGKAHPFVHLALSDGSGIVVVIGQMPGVLFKTRDMNDEAVRVLDEQIDLRRATDSQFDSNMSYLEQKRTRALLEKARGIHGPKGR